MIGGQQVDRAIRDRGNRCLTIRGRSQRRVHLRQRAVFEQVLVAQRQIVRRGLTGDWQPSALALRIASKEMAVLTCWKWMCTPVARAFSMSRATIFSSVSSGIPGTPSLRETGPSLTAPVS